MKLYSALLLSTLLFPTLASAQSTESRGAYVRMYPGRKDDVCWENQSAIWRAYGPALQASGERAFGYDIWCKNTRDIVSPERFEKDSLGLVERRKLPGGAWGSPEAKRIEDATSFHYDHGNGLDCYSVGSTLGGGTSALLVEGKIVYPWCYKEYHVLTHTPDTAQFELVYEPKMIGEDFVTEHRVITVVSGSRFCRCDVRYEGLTTERQVCAGVVLHGNEDQLRLNHRQHYIAYADPSDRPDDPAVGQVMIGIYAPQATQLMLSEGHALAVASYRPGDVFTYWFGSGWSHGDCPTLERMVTDLQLLSTH